MALGDKLRSLRLQKNIGQQKLAKKLGYKTNSYISDAENNRFIPSPEKLAKWVEILGYPPDMADDLTTEARLEELGLKDPAFTMMFKDVPNMTLEEKQSVIRAYEAVLESRNRKRIKYKRKK